MIECAILQAHLHRYREGWGGAVCLSWSLSSYKPWMLTWSIGACGFPIDTFNCCVTSSRTGLCFWAVPIFVSFVYVNKDYPRFSTVWSTVYHIGQKWFLLLRKKLLVVHTRVWGAEMLKYPVQYQLVSGSGIISGRAVQAFPPQAAERCRDIWLG